MSPPPAIEKAVVRRRVWRWVLLKPDGAAAAGRGAGASTPSQPAGSRFITSPSTRTGAGDPVAFGIVGIILSGAGALATVIPARRALAVAVILKQDM